MGIDTLWQQWQLLAGRLAAAAKERRYQALWTNASGTVIMRSVFTEARFHEGCAEFLYLFQLMATKTRNEAVVEGMGSVWDKVRTPPARCLQRMTAAHALCAPLAGE